MLFLQEVVKGNVVFQLTWPMKENDVKFNYASTPELNTSVRVPNVIVRQLAARKTSPNFGLG